MKNERRFARRDVIVLGATVVWMPASLVAAARWKKIPIAMQAWCVRKQMKGDIPGTLAAVARLGYEGIELENDFGVPGAKWREYLDAAKLRACGFHHRLDELRGEKLAVTIAFNKAIGNRNLIIRSLPKDVYDSKDLLLKTAAEVNEIAGKVASAGLRLGYHNHTTDFNKLGQDYWWNLFADATKKQNVMLQFDTGNASEMAGVDVVSFLKRNRGRTISLHAKPHSNKAPNAFIGEDELDWKAIMTTAETVGGLEWYIIEYEKEGVPPLEALAANLERFRKLRGA